MSEYSLSTAITFNGATHSLRDWARMNGISEKTLHTRLVNLGWSVERALTTPVRKFKDYHVNSSVIKSEKEEEKVDTRNYPAWLNRRDYKDWNTSKKMAYSDDDIRIWYTQTSPDVDRIQLIAELNGVNHNTAFLKLVRMGLLNYEESYNRPRRSYRKLTD